MPESQESWHGRREIQIKTSYKKSLGVLIVNYKYQKMVYFGFYFLYFWFCPLKSLETMTNPGAMSTSSIQILVLKYPLPLK